jgi:hypothetical protein
MTQAIQISKRLDDGTILVIGGDTPDEFAAHASEMVGSGAADLIALFYELVPASAGREIHPPPAKTVEPEPDSAVAAALKVLQAAGLSGTAVTEPAKPEPATPNGAPGCKHGTRVYKSGQSKGKFNTDGTPKEWKMWACPSKNRDDECEPSWIRG